MKIRAAVLEEFAQPLVVQEVDLDAARPGRGARPAGRLRRLPHRHVHGGGADPSGYAPTVLGHEGAGVVEAVGEGVTSLAPGDHVVTLFSPQCRECVHCVSDKTNLCLAIREQQNLGYLPDGTTRLHRGGERIRHFMGTRTFAEATVMPEIALAKVNPDAPLDVVCTLACGATTGIGAALYVAKVEPGSTCVGLRRRPRRPRRRRRRAAGRRRADHRDRPGRGAARAGARTTARPTRSSAARTRSSGSSR